LTRTTPSGWTAPGRPTIAVVTVAATVPLGAVPVLLMMEVPRRVPAKLRPMCAHGAAVAAPQTGRWPVVRHPAAVQAAAGGATVGRHAKLHAGRLRNRVPGITVRWITKAPVLTVGNPGQAQQAKRQGNAESAHHELLWGGECVGRRPASRARAASYLHQREIVSQAPAVGVGNPSIPHAARNANAERATRAPSAAASSVERARISWNCTHLLTRMDAAKKCCVFSTGPRLEDSDSRGREACENLNDARTDR
jgi:hypothetical protein